MKKSQLYLFATVLWLVSVAIWIVHLCVDFHYDITPEGLVVMHGFCVICSSIAAGASFIRYRQAKADEEET